MGNRNLRIKWKKPELVGGAWNKHFLKKHQGTLQVDPDLRPGRRLQPERWFMQRFAITEDNPTAIPKKRIRVKLELDHNHAEDVIWCNCGFRRHNKRGWIGDIRQKGMYSSYTGQSTD